MPITSSTLPACVTLTLTEKKRASAFRIQCGAVADAPTEFVFEGSEDSGETWEEIDYRINVAWSANQVRDFPVVLPLVRGGSGVVGDPFLGYNAYRLRVIVTSSGDLSLGSFQVLADLSPVTVNRTATSAASQAHADWLASQKAQQALTELLAANCRQYYTKTHVERQECPTGEPKSGIGIGYSFESEADAQAQAEEEAVAKLGAALLTCAGQTETIIIPKDEQLEVNAAKPYPSGKLITSGPGVIASVRVILRQISHGRYRDIGILLVSPASPPTCVELLRLDGAVTNPDDTFGSFGDQSDEFNARFPGIDITFDDAAGSPLDGTSVLSNVTVKPSVDGASGAINYPQSAPQSPPFTYNTTLAAFNGENANGLWKLFIVDRATGYPGKVWFGWDIEFN